jgi:hypothetical protein
MSIQNITSPRLKSGNSSYPYSQSTGSYLVSPGIQKKWVYTPSSTPASFGNMTLITLKSQGVIASNALLINCSSMTGASGSTTIAPMAACISSIAYEVGGRTFQILYGTHQFLHGQCYNDDMTRMPLRLGMGDYQSATQRLSMSSVTSTYIVPLFDAAREMGDFFLSNPQSEITMKITFLPLSQCTTPVSTTAVMNINSVTLLSEVVKMSMPLYNNRISNMSKLREVSVYHDVFRIPCPITAGSVNVVQNLACAGKNVTEVMFVLRLANPTNENLFSGFLPVLNYSVNDQNGQPITNQSQSLDGNVWKTYMNPYSSSITLEANTSANVYGLVFSSDTCLASVGGMGGCVLFVGTEVLSLSLTPNANALFLEIFVKYEMNLIQSVNGNDTMSTNYVR